MAVVHSEAEASIRQEGPMLLPPTPRFWYDAMAMRLLPALLQGQYGSMVVIDIIFHSHKVSLLRHPEVFRQLLDQLETPSSVLLQSGNIFASLELILMPVEDEEPVMLVNPESGAPVPLAPSRLFCLSQARCPIFPILVSILASPKMKSIVLGTRLLYRLLFLLLGSDRIEPQHVIDVESAVRVTEAAGLASFPLHALSTTASSDAAAAAEEGTTAGSDTNETKESHLALGDSAGSLPQPPNRLDWKEAVKEQDYSVKGLEAMIATHRRTAIEISTSRLDAGQKEASRTAAAVPSTPALANSRALRQLSEQELYSGAAVVAQFYLQHLFPYEKRKVLTGARHISEVEKVSDSFVSSHTTPSTDSMAWMWKLRSSTLFFCELMAYHGVYVSSPEFDRLVHEVSQQAEALRAYGQLWIDRVWQEQGGAVPSVSPLLMDEVFEELSINGMLRCVEMRLHVENSSHPQVKYFLQMIKGLLQKPKQDPRSFQRLVLELSEVVEAESVDSPCPPNPRCPEEVEGSSNADAAALSDVLYFVQAWLTLKERLQYVERIGACTLLGDRIPSASRLHVQAVIAPEPLHLEPNLAGEAAPTTHKAFSVHPHWALHALSSNRLFASQPNIQTVPQHPAKMRYPLPWPVFKQLYAPSSPPSLSSTSTPLPLHSSQHESTAAAEETPSSGCSSPLRYFLRPLERAWTPRHLFLPPPHTFLLSFDYNQQELRLLAHMSNDTALINAFQQGEDVLNSIARHVLFPNAPNTPSPPRKREREEVLPPPPVTDVQRSAIKTVVYGLVYGMGQKKIDVALKKLRDPGLQSASQTLMQRFESLFPQLMHYLKETRHEAKYSCRVRTLWGTVSLARETNPFRRQQSAVALAIQGGASDVLQGALQMIHAERHSYFPYLPVSPFALCIAMHDELTFAASSAGGNAVVSVLVEKISRAMERQAEIFGLRVPLKVKVRVGPNWGSLHPFDAVSGEGES